MDEQRKMTRKALSLTEKLGILRKLDAENVISKTAFAKSVGIHESTLRALLKNRQKLENSALAGGSGRKKIRTPKYEEMEKVLFEWLTVTRSPDTRTTGTLIKEKACEIATNLGMEFTPNNAWVDRFRQRCERYANIKYAGTLSRRICVESTAVNIDDVNCWKNNVLVPLLNKYPSSDIYNVDELGLFFKLMPDETMAFKDERCFQGELSEERVTVLVGTNMDGSDKLDPLVIGKSRNPRYFNNARNLLCEYESQSKAWMTSDLFVKWIRKFDQRMKEESRKVLCLADHCPAHPKDIAGLQNVQLVILPSSVVHPMKQGIIHVLKVNYRKRVALRHLHQIDHRGQDLSCPTCTPVRLLDAMHFLSASWEDVTPTTIAKYFRKAFDVDGTSQDGDISEEEQLREESEDWDTFAKIDDQVLTCEIGSTGDIIDDITSSEEPRPSEEAEGDVDENTDPPAVPSFASVTNAFSLLRLYASSLDDIPSAKDFFHHLNKAENFLIKSHPTFRQTKVQFTQSSQSSEHIEDEKFGFEFVETTTNDEYQGLIPENPPSPQPSSVQAGMKRSYTEAESPTYEKQIKTESTDPQTILHSQDTLSEASNRGHLDDCYDYFGRYVASMLRTVGPPDSILLQQEITVLITNKLCSLNRNQC